MVGIGNKIVKRYRGYILDITDNLLMSVRWDTYGYIMSLGRLSRYLPCVFCCNTRSLLVIDGVLVETLSGIVQKHLC